MNRLFWIKIFIFISILSILIGGAKILYPDVPHENSIQFSSEDTSIVFIGSSRVMHGIDTAIIQSYFPSWRISNLGIMSSNFLNHCMLAEYLMLKPGNKTLLVELSAYKPKIPSTFLNVLPEKSLIVNQDGVLSCLPLRERILALSDAGNYWYGCVSLNTPFKKMMGIREIKQQQVGFTPSDENAVHSVSTIISSDNIQAYKTLKALHTPYMRMIDRLKKKAEESNTRLIFVLPVTSKRQEELEHILPVFNAIPDSLKIEYPESFYNNIQHSEFLKDLNHLNRRGAKLYSEMLCEKLNQ